MTLRAWLKRLQQQQQQQGSTKPSSSPCPTPLLRHSPDPPLPCKARLLLASIPLLSQARARAQSRALPCMKRVQNPIRMGPMRI